MKVRVDYVSNSSSSSFICLASEADKSGMMIYGDSDRIDFKTYCDDYIWRDVFNGYDWGQYILEKESRVKFVDDETLQREFASGIYLMLPESARNDFKEFCDGERNNKFDSYAKDEIRRKLYEALKPKWGDASFLRVEAGDEYAYDGVSDEENMRDEFYGHDFTFARSFNNH